MSVQYNTVPFIVIIVYNNKCHRITPHYSMSYSVVFVVDSYIQCRRPSGLVGNLHTAINSAEVVSSILTKVGFVFFLS